MKKTLTTLTLILGLALTGMAQMAGGGLFQRGEMAESNYFRSSSPLIMPTEHGSDYDYPSVPLGGGVLVLGALGAAYLVGKKRRKE